MQSPCEVSAAAHLPQAVAKGVAMTLLRLEGVPPSIAYRRDKLIKMLAPSAPLHQLKAEDSRAQWISVRDVHPFAGPSDRYVWRLSVPPAEGARVAASLARQLDMRWFYDWTGGLIWLEVPPTADAAASLIRAAIPQGHATLMRADEATRNSVPIFQPQPAALSALARRVKTAFDPLGIFNPGRMQESY